MAHNWCFGCPGGWMAPEVTAVPSEDKARQFIDPAVRTLASHEIPRLPVPCVVVCHVTAPAFNGVPGGPVGRAKTALDALHDGRRSTGPTYTSLGSQAPLTGDSPEYVCGLAVEVQPGSPRTAYQIGVRLQVNGALLTAVPVGALAPNDVPATPSEGERIKERRAEFGREVRAAFPRDGAGLARKATALLVRHHPQRDEDNTWQTWTTALCGSRNTSPDHWAAGAPLQGWRPTAVASLADPSLGYPVVYEVWA